MFRTKVIQKKWKTHFVSHTFFYKPDSFRDDRTAGNCYAECMHCLICLDVHCFNMVAGDNSMIP
jgi:hypothetical protein